jgi:hypothetical protein
MSVVEALKGRKLTAKRDYLYWDYGHCRGKAYAQAVRMGDWKGIRPARTGKMELYDLSEDIGETTDLAAQHPGVVQRIASIMEKAVIPNPRYEVGTVYKGKPIWQKNR